VHLEPVVAPVDALGIPGQPRAVLVAKLRPERPGVRALEDEALAGDEGEEELPGHVEHLELPVDALQRLVGARQHRRPDRRAPGEASVLDQLAQTFRGGAEERSARGLVERGRGG